MGRFGVVEERVFRAARSECRAGLDSVTLRTVVARRLARYLRADAFCAMEIDPTTTLPVHHVNHGWPADYLEPLAEHALFASPAGDTATLLRSRRRAVTTDELVGGARVGDDPYYQFHILPYGYRYELQLMCKSAGLSRALFTFNRRESSGPFEARHLRLADALAPHIGAAVHAASVRASLAAPDASDSGFIQLGATGEIESAAGAGARLLQTCRSRAEAIGLRVLLALARRSLVEPDAAPHPMILSDPNSGAAYQLVTERSLSLDGRPRVAVLVEPARATGTAGLMRLGLTVRESQVALALVRGDTLAECARRVGSSPATVAHHKKRVFDKLDVSSRRGLAVRLLGHGWRGD